jgi:hypothetical protein
MCERQTAKKYTSRKSPPYPANKCCGEQKKGNDGNTYTSVPDKNGRCRWVLKNSKRKSSRRKSARRGSSRRKSAKRSTRSKGWFTHDNGGRPFLVIPVSNSIVDIYKAKSDEEFDSSIYTKLVKRYDNVEKLFVGKSLKNPTTVYSGGYGKWADGNSILLRLPKNRHVFIGDHVYEFTPPEPIEKYYSSVGNSDVPYPVALSKTFAYFMLAAPRRYNSKDKSFKLHYIKRMEFPKGIDWSDAYRYYYDTTFDSLKILKPKIIHSRIM